MAAYTVTGSGSRRQVNFVCQHCGAELASPLAEAGQRFPCPTCGVAFTTPGAAELAAPPMPTAAPAVHGRPATVAYAPAAPAAAARAASCPGIVMAAAIIWIVTGVPLLLLAAGTFLLGLSVGGGGLFLLGLTLLVAGFGGVFVAAGVNTLRGAAADTLGNGIGSILFGLLFGCAGLTASHGTGGVALIVAGILALVGRSRYLEWQSARDRPQRPRRVLR